MDRVNPLYIARNHKVEEALTAAVQGDMSRYEHLLSLLKNPFERVEGAEDYEEPAPKGCAPHVTFCGT
jgi:uncharacterized protein YdiU (UPF0061 family)